MGGRKRGGRKDKREGGGWREREERREAERGDGEDGVGGREEGRERVRKGEREGCREAEGGGVKGGRNKGGN